MSDSKIFDFKAKRPLVIAGPCSAETERQVMETCLLLSAVCGVDVLRAGIWKPRTNPDSFEGVGTDGLRWLKTASAVTGLPTAVEVATPAHVEEALRYGVDILWVGSRTTVSPFAVQEIADSLRGVKGTAVLVKNPISPDAELWSGAVTRFLNVGIDASRIGLVHRGFSGYGRGVYRNAPVWSIPLNMRNRFPGMTLICDPSHIAGRSDLVASVAQTAADLRFDGLMVESHCNPRCALSDAAQQLTPADLKRVLDSIRWRRDRSDDPAFMRELNGYREAIDGIDARLFALLAERMALSADIARLKQANDVAIFQPERWRQLTANVIDRTRGLGLSEEFIRDMLELIHMESISRQAHIMNDKDD